VRIDGHGTHQNGHSLRSLGAEMIERGYRAFYVDLVQCQGLDSTFLGLLANLAMRLRETGEEGGLCLLNVGARNQELLETLGLDRLLRTEPCPTEMPPDEDFRELPGSDLTRFRSLDTSEAAALVLQAHEDLCRADPRNEARFAGVKQLLREGIPGKSGRLNKEH
jgi:anti-anti-sigma regulatory factor